ncbi:MAG: beta-ketoacyl-ACP synthase II [Anaerolineae bacterium]|nr:beta-ketoacyl-ACP synthase II [Anaerolineae bacterium]MDW8072232.1 beta-ketoacyl-ACP synthase II [Anaerolineae bacterium]
MFKRVVITGLGAVTPLGHDVPSTWEALKAGRSGIRRITSFDPSNLATQFAGEVVDFDPLKYFDRREARRMDRVTQFAIVAADEALADSGLLNAPINKDRIGVVVSSAVGGITTLLENQEILRTRGPNKLNPWFIPMMLVDTPSAQLGIRYGFRGPNMAVVTACATGSNAVGEAFEMVARGAADAIVAGGAEAALLPIVIAGFDVMGAMSLRNDAPEKACRPFDRDRDGFVVSEGAAVMVLESLEHALARGARIYAEFAGYGTSVDADHMAAPLASGEGAAVAIRAALARAGMQPTDIDYINAHGTSTKLNDVAETNAIKLVFGEHAYKVPISSTKSMTGHLLAGAGALEALVCVKTIEEGIIPPTINLENPDPECDLDYVPNVARRANVRVAMSNSFGFGGHNATVIIKRYEA